MIQRVVSGGQTGCDVAALRAAKACGLEVGGWCPRGFLTEDGPMPELLRGYGLRETPTAEYPPRTRRNVKEADATLILALAAPLTGGTLLTWQLTQVYHRPVWVALLYPKHQDYFGLVLIETRNWLRRVDPFTLNIGGPRESRHPGIGALAEAFLVELFAALREGQQP